MTSIFPKLRREDILEFQFSSWYPRFKSISIKSTVISPLSDEFCRYLRSDGVFVPHGSENKSAALNGRKFDMLTNTLAVPLEVR